MIECTYSEVFFLYFLFWLLLILFLWRREETRVRRNEWRVSRNQLFYCETCKRSFVNRGRAISICRCPRCNRVCIRRRERDLPGGAPSRWKSRKRPI